jgi:hypothetical protein
MLVPGSVLGLRYGPNKLLPHRDAKEIFFILGLLEMKRLAQSGTFLKIFS